MNIIGIVLSLFLSLNVFTISLTEKAGKVEYKDAKETVILDSEFSRNGVWVKSMQYDTTKGISKLSLTIDPTYYYANGVCEVNTDYFPDQKNKVSVENWKFEIINKDTDVTITQDLKNRNEGEFKLQKGWNRFDFRSYYLDKEGRTIGVLELIDVFQVKMP